MLAVEGLAGETVQCTILLRRSSHSWNSLHSGHCSLSLYPTCRSSAFAPQWHVLRVGSRCCNFTGRVSTLKSKKHRLSQELDMESLRWSAPPLQLYVLTLMCSVERGLWLTRRLLFLLAQSRLLIVLVTVASRNVMAFAPILQAGHGSTSRSHNHNHHRCFALWLADIAASRVGRGGPSHAHCHHTASAHV